MQDEVKVTQADREAAASIAVLVEMRELILSGRADHHAEPFARHRHQANEDVKKWARIANDAVTRGLSLERELAEARHQAERETLARMEPVAWMYERGGVKHVVTERATDLPAFVAVGWTETPLYALPPAPEAGQ